MTIKELMEHIGISRANIRYYEEEGLLAPKRLPNGYRDYSEEDKRTLEKIKLLRQLHLDIDTIRLVQKGELTLEQALFSLLNKLEGDKIAISQSAEVCRELCQSGVEYNALDPVQWLKKLDFLSRSGSSVLSEPSQPQLDDTNEPQPDGDPACYHPIMRLMARSLDTMLYVTVFYVIALGVFRAHWLLKLAPWINWLESVAWLAVTLALEPLWLHFWGWTPGKWIFGLKLRNKDGKKLSLAQARERCWDVIWHGYRCNFPIWSQISMWKCFTEGLKGLNSDWDMSGGYRYTKVERFQGKLTSGILWATVCGACIAAAVLAGLQMVLPINRSDLTVAQFAENCNYYSELMGNDFFFRLESDGRWTGWYMLDNHVTVSFDNETVLDPVYTLKDGHVTAVTLRIDYAGRVVYTNHLRERQLMLALTGAVDGFNLFNFDLDGWLDFWNRDDRWGSFEADYRGLHISQTVEYAGYEHHGDEMIAFEDQEHFYRRTVTVSLIED